MKEPKLPKFSWGKTFEHNSGHTKNEWGGNEEKSNIKFIVAYTVKGDLEKVKTHGFLTSFTNEN
jgi:hypothetical protein